MTNHPSPLVTIAMAVYNDAAFLPETLASLAAQTLQDYELIVVNDASTDASGDILAAAAKKDPRIRVITNTTNLKLPKNLNIILEQAKGRYIARMDADDIAHPTRLAEQVEFMESRPEIVALGTWAEKFGAETGPIRTPSSPSMAAASLPFLNPLVHPSVMLRTATLRAHNLGYDPQFYCEDYHFWVRLAEFGAITSLPRVLLNYRIRQGSMTSNSNNFRRAELRPVLQLALHNILKKRKLQTIITPWVVEMHARFALHEKPTVPQLLALPFWLLFLLLANPTPAFAATLAKRKLSFLLKALKGQLLPPQPTSTWRPPA